MGVSNIKINQSAEDAEISRNMLLKWLSNPKVEEAFFKEDFDWIFQNLLDTNHYALGSLFIKTIEDEGLALPQLMSKMTSVPVHFMSYETSLTSITIPGTISTIGESAFLRCKNLKEVIVRPGVTSLGNNAFDGCKSLKTITLPDTLINIGDAAFFSCSSLRSIELPDSITELNDHVFRDCSKLSSVKLPISLKSIGKYCFAADKLANPTDIVFQYRGTKAQFKSIKKVYHWVEGRGLTVKCVDGVLRYGG